MPTSVNFFDLASMSDKQNIAVICCAPVAASVLILGILRANFFSDAVNIILACIILVTACTVILIGLKQASRKEALWLPSFAALATFKCLAFCSFCAYIALWVADILDVTTLSRVAPPIEFILLMTFAPLIGFCLLLSVFVFFIAMLIVRLVPRAHRKSLSASSRVRATRAANVAALCLGLLSVCVISKIG